MSEKRNSTSDICHTANELRNREREEAKKQEQESKRTHSEMYSKLNGNDEDDSAAKPSD